MRQLQVTLPQRHDGLQLSTQGGSLQVEHGRVLIPLLVLLTEATRLVVADHGQVDLNGQQLVKPTQGLTPSADCCVGSPFPGSTDRSSSAAERWGAPPRWPRRKVCARGRETNGRSSTSPLSAEQKQPSKIKQRLELELVANVGLELKALLARENESRRTERLWRKALAGWQSRGIGGRWCFWSKKKNHFLSFWILWFA